MVSGYSSKHGNMSIGEIYFDIGYQDIKSDTV